MKISKTENENLPFRPNQHYLLPSTTVIPFIHLGPKQLHIQT